MDTMGSQNIQLEIGKLFIGGPLEVGLSRWFLYLSAFHHSPSPGQPVTPNFLYAQLTLVLFADRLQG